MSAPYASSRSDARPEISRHVIQGDHAVSCNPNEALLTVLGSCVATCMYDEVAGVGGMNHYLLPHGSGETSDNKRYGVNAMELLINGLLKAGASRARLKAKLFGGARMMDGFSDIGAQNAAFAVSFLEAEGIGVVSESLGGRRARRVRFWPATGRAQQLLLAETVTVPTNPVPVPQSSQSSVDVELF